MTKFHEHIRGYLGITKFAVTKSIFYLSNIHEVYNTYFFDTGGEFHVIRLSERWSAKWNGATAAQRFRSFSQSAKGKWVKVVLSLFLWLKESQKKSNCNTYFRICKLVQGR